METALSKKKSLVTAVDWILRTGDCPVRKLETALGSGQCMVTAVSTVNIWRLLCPSIEEKIIDKLASDPKIYRYTCQKLRSTLDQEDFDKDTIEKEKKIDKPLEEKKIDNLASNQEDHLASRNEDFGSAVNKLETALD